MNTSQTKASRAGNRRLKAARLDVANSMIGRSVSLLVDARKIARGTVVGVMLDAGVPKIVVNGACYDPRQVLSSWPIFLN
jgi:hypothetical protein